MNDVVWLLDIDGVINAPAKPGARPPTHAWPVDAWIDTKADNGTTWRILAARPVLDFIRSVHEQGRAEIRWHTTWQERSAEVAKALDLPDFPVQEAPEFDQTEEHLRRDQWWKLPAVWRVLSEGHRVLWTDDDASWDLTADQKTRLAAAGCHIVSPDPMTGLYKKHLQQIDEFLPPARLTTVD